MHEPIGELCPKCKKGKLYPTGKVIFEKPDVEPTEGVTRNEDREYECDNCHKKSGYGEIHLNAIIDETKLKKNEKTKKQ